MEWPMAKSGCSNWIMWFDIKTNKGVVLMIGHKFCVVLR